MTPVGYLVCETELDQMPIGTIAGALLTRVASEDIVVEQEFNIDVLT